MLSYLCYSNDIEMVRASANSTEALCIVISLYFWLKREDDPKNDIISRVFTVIGFMSRATIVLTWAIIWPY
jgi:hypothetical protein